MLTGSELSTAITAILIAAVGAGFMLRWLWSYLNRSRTSDSARLEEMAERLHEADMARETAELARSEAEALLAAMQTRLDGAIEGREAELTRKLAKAELDLETMRDGLGHARRRQVALEAEVEELRRRAG